MDEAKRKGPRPPFGPFAKRESVALSRFAADVLEAAGDRSGRPKSNVVDLLLRKHGGSVTAEDFATLPGDCASAD